MELFEQIIKFQFILFGLVQGSIEGFTYHSNVRILKSEIAQSRRISIWLIKLRLYQGSFEGPT